jgi:hypothetical protein
MRLLTAISMLMFLSAASTAGAQEYQAPRTSWGDPDLSGVFTNKDEYGTPFERPDEFAGKTFADFGPAEMAALRAERLKRERDVAPSIGGSAEEDTGAGPPHWYEHLEAVNSQPWFVIEPADGKIPAMTPEARQRQAAQRAKFAKRARPDSYADMSFNDRCVSRGLPGSMVPGIYGSSYDITQAPGMVAIRYEMIHETRLIPLDGSAHAPSAQRFHMGDARGHFEGDTLVVETTNFLEGAAYRNATPGLKIVERFTPVDASTLRWEIRFEDPATWAAPWAFAMPLKRDPTQAMFEYACHEGNRGLAGILSAARAADRADAQR